MTDAKQWHAADGARVVAALAIAGVLFVSDFLMPIEMNEVQLYPLALFPLYRLPSRAVLWVFCALAVALIVLGYALAPDPDFWDGLSNRTFSVVMVVVMAAALHRLSTSERALILRAVTDPLTGVFNRRTFMELADKEEARALRRRSNTAVLMLDIDHFKKVNDTYGHAAGDEVIKALAQTAGKVLRPSDVFARYGGEEFVVTLPETDIAVALKVAERLRAALEQTEVAAGDHRIRFTASIGVALCPAGETIKGAMVRADEALYRAKAAGRNRVEVAETPDAPAAAVAPAATAAD